MKKIKVILSVLLMAAAISFTACSNASSGSSDPSTPATPSSPSTPSSGGGSGSGSGSGGGSPAPTVTYIGSKAPSQAKEVGDIVFNDGSATPYTMVNSLTAEKKQAAVAIIFYVGTDLNSGTNTTSRTLGVGIKHNTTGLAWCDGSGASGTAITAIQCTYNESTGNITGDKNGSDNLSQIASAGVSDTTDADKYPAFYFGKNYSTTATNLGLFSSDWYLPSIAELQQIYIKGKGSEKTFDIDAVLQALEGNKFEELYWSSSQCNNDNTKALFFNFSNGTNSAYTMSNPNPKVCAIREFKTYGIIIQATSNGTVTSSKTSGVHPGETITLTASPATHYRLSSLIVTDSDGTNVTVTNNSFVMPAKNVSISASFAELPKYTVTYSDGVDNADITVPNDTNQYYEGDEVTVKFTEIGERSDYTFASWSNGTTSFTSYGTKKFAMGNSNVTLTAQWITYKGSKTPETAKDVGDIVFNDGSAMPYSDFNNLSTEGKNSRKNDAIALIFYKGTGLNSDAADGTPNTTTSRTLGLGLKFDNSGYIPSRDWCTSAANAYNRNIETINCKYSGSAGSHTFTGDKNGSDNLEQIKAYLEANNITDDTGTESKYPAFYYAKNYSSRVTNLGSFTSGWYLPSIAELYQIYVNGIGPNKLFDIDTLLSALCNTDCSSFIPSHIYWSSSQCASDQGESNANKKAISISFNAGTSQNEELYGAKDKDNSTGTTAHCIREFN